MFTFVVTCYNQADVVRYALESIRYQIEQYGEGQSFQLVVTDDGSTDKSVGVIDQWIAGRPEEGGRREVPCAERGRPACPF